MTDLDYYPSICAGVYSKSSVPNGEQPFVSVTFSELTNAKVAMAISNFDDLKYIGKQNNDYTYSYVCDQEAVLNQLCSNSTLGSMLFTISELNTTSIQYSQLTITPTTNGKVETVNYLVNETGYYCVTIFKSDPSSNDAYEAAVEWKNPYGELPGAEYPKLIFYGLMVVIYLGFGIFWAVQSFRFWSDILSVQNYIGCVVFFLMIEMAVNWGYWENYNVSGRPSWTLLGAVAVMSAARNSISFFMLLIVCLGYGVVKPSLGDTMKKCVILAATHFFFGVIYAIGTMLMTPEEAGYIILLVVFPLSITMTLFYVWTLQAIQHTLQVLDLRKQHMKAKMYKRLWRLLVWSVVMVVAFFVINMISFGSDLASEWPARNWQYRWFMLDGWLNVLYFIVFITIAILWRPTDNNKRYGLEQLASNEEEAIDLENQLQAAENAGYDGLKIRTPNGDGEGRVALDEDAAIFELGDEISDEDDDRGHPSRSSQPPPYKARSSPSGVAESEEEESDEEGSGSRNSESARLTQERRKIH
ncbi:hypothetical protein BZG36_02730 [Bifiguratus adelaidae]|uniref:Lung seven transmembrane receptor-domain-containing protein n=1 Tax=Bifiguratus adelaidae TaxID=1938954 RepID=A0A261XYL4_9FUNG|nr:hypothetical protein BZG36_02730 [Bifiguratus adelaidae]